MHVPRWIAGSPNLAEKACEISRHLPKIMPGGRRAQLCLLLVAENRASGNAH